MSLTDITTCSIFSLLPPSSTLREYQRKTLSTTGSQLGTLYTAIVSFASRTAQHRAPDEQQRAKDTAEIVRTLIAVRAKLGRSMFLKANTVYEVGGCLLAVISPYILSFLQFSLRGRWPAQRYQTILDLQLYAPTPISLER
jgi:hypothetical protein